MKILTRTIAIFFVQYTETEYSIVKKDLNRPNLQLQYSTVQSTGNWELDLAQGSLYRSRVELTCSLAAYGCSAGPGRPP